MAVSLNTNAVQELRVKIGVSPGRWAVYTLDGLLLVMVRNISGLYAWAVENGYRVTVTKATVEE